MSKIKKQSGLLVIGYAGAVMFFLTVNPDKLSLLYILIPFIMIFGLLFASVNIFLGNFFNISNANRRLISFVVSVIPVFLLIVQSISQLTVRDVLISVAVALIIIWYSLKIQAKL